MWTGARTQNGYGQIAVSRQIVYAHRFSFLLAHGAIAPGAWILHRCDVKLCVRPDHLYAGTIVENTRDAVLRGRYQTGDNHPMRRRPDRRARGERHGTHTHPEAFPWMKH